MDEKFHEQASQLELDRRSDALAKVRSTLSKKGQADCEDCGETSPAARPQRHSMHCMPTDF